jgi:hypothetical protein
VGQTAAASMGGSFNRHACPRKDFRGMFFLRKFFRNSVSINVSRRPLPPRLRREKAGRCRMAFIRRACVPQVLTRFAATLPQAAYVLAYAAYVLQPKELWLENPDSGP